VQPKGIVLFCLVVGKAGSLGRTGGQTESEQEGKERSHDRHKIKGGADIQ
jgi:hypothetical protein